MIDEKHKLRKLYKRTRIDHYKTQYNKLNKNIKELIKNEHRHNWQTKCNNLDLADHQDKTWPQLKQMMGLKPTKTKYPTLITYDEHDNVIKSTTTEQKVKTLTSTFENIFTHDNTKTYYNDDHKHNVEDTIKSYAHQLAPQKTIPSRYKETEHAITKQDIESTINKLKTKKASGPDKISNTIIKYIKPSLIDILYTLYNISWHKGYHSINWKTPITILFNKPNKPASNPSNYRPISLINNLSKILETIIKNKLTNWAETNNKINKEQAGFQKNKSTHDKIFELIQTVMHAKNMKNFSAAIFMDVEKAFDKVWHAGLIHTLINIQLPMIYLRYITSFISQRHMFFRIENL